MKVQFPLLVFAALLVFSAAPEKSCASAESLIGFIRNHVEKAMAAEEINMTRYHTYKAVNTIEKARPQFEDCGCDYANKNIHESLESLKLATRVSTLEGARILLQRAMEYALASRDALEDHESHGSRYGDDRLALNTADAPEVKAPAGSLSMDQIEGKIDLALEKYRKSLEDVVQDVPCREALEFVERIYAHCERQLLREDLTPAKRYYNMRTKDITENALKALGDCSN
ncbi:hypothetical protein OZ410_08310 [Robiginitalea sp. M366]|uniref:hypothetical protein n=1 Tax=Robiginitalea aestuariiviva TaxID=3036903 RepID=UPI00240D2D39|nr:hypothetical protein [Robiginitalea aestuariiviva]MDG1572315.1 hypothetical protein [Robiginitalea aestuariiviva]